MLGQWLRNRVATISCSALLAIVGCSSQGGTPPHDAVAGAKAAPTAGAGTAVTAAPPASVTPAPSSSTTVASSATGAGGTGASPVIGVPAGGTSGGPDQSAQVPETANPHWISYGNGPKNQFYNPTETKISVETAPMLKVLWMMQLGEITGAPSVIGDTVYAASNAGLFAVDAANGSTKWTAPIRSTSAPFYDEETKLLFVSDQGGRIHGVDSMTGTEKWASPISMQSGTNGWSSPIVTRGKVVVGVGAIDMGGFKGGVSAFDTMTGKKLWEYTQAKTAGASVWSGPGADDDGIIYATSGNNYGQPDDRSDSIFALADAGTSMWNFQAEMGDAWTFSGGVGPDNDFGANPIILDLKGRKLIAAGRKSGDFHLVDRTTGAEITRVKLSDRSQMATGGILNNGAYDGKNQLFITAANEAGAPGQTVALSADPDMMLKEIWRIKNTGVVWGQVSTANGVCFVPDNTVLRILNCLDGTELTTFTFPGTIGSAPAVSEGRVFFGAGFTYSLSSTIRPGRLLVAVGF
jgi:polyvinyl alcohol dehydrogenase (cytochrome)